MVHLNISEGFGYDLMLFSACGVDAEVLKEMWNSNFNTVKYNKKQRSEKNIVKNVLIQLMCLLN